MTRCSIWCGLVAVGLVLARDAPKASGRAIAPVNVGRVPSSSPLPHHRGHSLTTHRSHAPPRTLPAGSTLRIRGVASDIRRVHLVGHEMQVPLDPRDVGWWTSGASPGSSHGTVVIVGHVNYDGVDGALSVLPSLRPGDRVVVAEPRRNVRYRIAAVRTYAKTSGIPPSVFGQSTAPRLVLITCGGPFDSSTGNYEDNIIAFANPVG